MFIFMDYNDCTLVDDDYKSIKHLSSTLKLVLEKSRCNFSSTVHFEID